ncbi:MAG: phosphatase PAP2 family protein [Chloroflexi bacterium]|nr:phosphatase PAP2 family protein [Chloroflexota bacterium]
MNDPVLTLHDWASSSPTLTSVVVLIALYGIWVLPLTLVVGWFWPASGRTERRRAISAGCLAAAVALGLGQVLERTLDRPRPFVALGFTPLVPHVADASFPSDHTMAGVALVSPLLWSTSPRTGALLLIWALVVGVSRVAAGLHYASDVFASAVLGLALGGLASFVLERWLPARATPGR